MGNSTYLKKTMLVSAIVLLGTLCFGAQGYSQPPQPLAIKQARKVELKPSAYLVYWDVKAGSKELEDIGGHLESVSYFGAYFDNKDSLIIAPKIAELKNQQNKLPKTVFLTVVNDVETGDNNNLYKDTAVLERVLATPEDIDSHIKSLLQLTKQHGFNGLEIDYENVWKKSALPMKFMEFINKLVPAAQAQNIKLRIILEPSVPFYDVQWPEGAEYVVMFYNLYGGHSLQDGPKADQNFIYTTLNKIKGLPDSRTVALATGGWLWSTKGKPKSVTEKEAIALCKKNKVIVQRDPNSMGLRGRYRIGTTVYDLWYADAETLNNWILWTKQSGYGSIAFWRLGGNVSFNKINW